jgi:serine/threonine protein kinase
MAATSSSLRLLQAEVDPGEEDSYLRLLHNSKHIKYVTIAAGLYKSHDMCFEPVITALLEPLLPAGVWNYGYINKNPETGLPYFAKVAQKQFRGVSAPWHPTMVDHLDIVLGEKLVQGVYDATCSQFETPLVAKFACWEWDIGYIEDECTAYQWIEGHNIEPKFLGNINEEGRVIGFLMERVTDETGDARHATPADHEACSQALAKLHQLGILHGDINKYNLLVTNKGVTLVDFCTARKCEDASEFDKEMQSLEVRLGSDSRLGKPGGRFFEESDLEPCETADDGSAADVACPTGDTEQLRDIWVSEP